MHEFYRHYLDLFARMERWPYADILAYQAAMIERLARYVRDHVPVFANRVRPLFDGDDFRLARWGEVPILTRQELRAAAPALEAIELPAETGGTRPFSTSGSTGEPVQGRHTAVSDGMFACMRERLYRWHDFDPDKRMGFIFQSRSPEANWPEGKTHGNWSQRGHHGTSHQLNLLTPVEKQVDWLARMRPDYLSTAPSNLLDLARQARDAGLALKLDVTIGAGTPLLPEIRAVAAEVFGARAIEAYGSEETGFMAIQCPESELMHVCVDHVLLEVVDENGEPVRGGVSGRVIVTNFYNFATPLLRYEIGDLAEAAKYPCSCGRTLPSLARVVGRIRRPLIFPDGTRVLTQAAIVAAGVPELLPARQFQVVQVGAVAFEIRYVPESGAGPLDERPILERFRTMVHPEVRLSLVPVERIERAANGKYEDFIYLDAAAG